VLGQQIDEILSLDYDGYWDRGYSPDFRKVQGTMRAMLDKGQADQVVAHGMQLWAAADNLIESLDHEGEIGMELGGCMELVFEAVLASSMPSFKRLCWMIVRFLEDEYRLLFDGEEWLKEGSFSAQDWSHAADDLAQRLSSMPSGKGSFSLSFQRSKVLSWLIRALEESGRDGIVELLEKEAPKTGEYGRLVDALEEAGEHEKAKSWAIKGFEDMFEHSPGTAWRLADKMKTMAARFGDHAQVAALEALAFFDRPHLQGYVALEDVTAGLGLWPQVRENLLSFLETGTRPDAAKTPKALPAWPLPAPWVTLPPQSPRKVEFPDHHTLVEIAVHEKRHDDAVARFREWETKSRWGAPSGLTLADAVQKTHPEFSLDTWRKHAESLIERVDKKAYQEASRFLRKMKKLHEETGRAEDWAAYVRTLRQRNRRRPRMMEVIDALEQRPVIKSG
ncbi:MAG: hypothetical protein JRI97_12975, partial [Deltaproteobacteria bacterium]|nr:hypothetical protein [Deltaproteobacteria bacterium]